MSTLRREVLNSFKNLHRARKEVFQGDEKALTLARQRINDEYRKDKGNITEDEVKQKLKLANEVASELRANVIQAVQKDEGVFEARIRESTTRLDNIPFDPNAKIPPPRQRKCK